MFELLNQFSYLAIVLILVFTGMGLPIPEEVPIIAAGVASSYNQLNPWLALAACLIGAVAGDCVMYGMGYHFGHGLLRDHRWFSRILRADREQRVEQMIANHGIKVLFVARFLVGLRAPVYITAGILRMPFRRFVMVDLVCATSVVGLFFTLSYVYGQRIERLIRSAELTLTITAVVATVALAGILWWRHRAKKAAAAAAHVMPAAHPLQGAESSVSERETVA